MRIIQTKDERNISAVTQQPRLEITDWNSSILRWKVVSKMPFMRRLALGVFCVLLPAWAQENPIQQLVEAARGGSVSTGLAGLVTKTLSPHGGTAVWGEDYLFVSDLAPSPTAAPVPVSEAGISIDGQ